VMEPWQLLDGDRIVDVIMNPVTRRW